MTPWQQLLEKSLKEPRQKIPEFKIDQNSEKGEIKIFRVKLKKSLRLILKLPELKGQPFTSHFFGKKIFSKLAIFSSKQEFQTFYKFDKKKISLKIYQFNKENKQKIDDFFKKTGIPVSYKPLRLGDLMELRIRVRNYSSLVEKLMKQNRTTEWVNLLAGVIQPGKTYKKPNFH